MPILAPVLLGPGITFFSGATEAWLVDGLNATGYRGSLDAAIAKEQVAAGIAMLGGTIGGGFMAQWTNLGVPYLCGRCCSSSSAVAIPMRSPPRCRSGRPSSTIDSVGAAGDRAVVGQPAWLRRWCGHPARPRQGRLRLELRLANFCPSTTTVGPPGAVLSQSFHE